MCQSREELSIEVPFNEEKHAAALKDGSMQFEDSREWACIYIHKRVSNHKGGGFGTASMRHIVDLSFKRGRGGNIESSTSYSSHLFHLYMGMRPFDSKINYIEYCFGIDGPAILKKLEDGQYRQECPRSEFSGLCRMYRLAKKLDPKTTVTLEEINANSEFLLSLRQIEGSYIQHIFVPRLICLLKENVNEKFPNTHYWGGITMILSEEGKARWKHAIDNKLEFRPFKNMEQLHRYMTDEQKNELAELLKARVERFKPAVSANIETNATSQLEEPTTRMKLK